MYKCVCVCVCSPTVGSHRCVSGNAHLQYRAAWKIPCNAPNSSVGRKVGVEPLKMPSVAHTHREQGGRVPPSVGESCLQSVLGCNAFYDYCIK